MGRSAEFTDGAVRARQFTYQPVGLDAWDPKPHQPKPGQRVVVTTAKGVGKPPGPMGKKFHYVADASTGEFHGMVLRASLQPVKKGKG